MPDTNAAVATPPGRITIQNYERMGQLVKSWTTGVDHLHLNNGVDYTKAPIDMAGLLSQMQSAGVGPNIPSDIMALKLEVVQNNNTTYYMRLPNTRLMTQSETDVDHMPAGTDYGLPPFYKTLAFHVDPNIGHPHKFHDCRIGDYTVSNCR